MDSRSTANTPTSNKRSRDEKYQALLDEPPFKQMDMTPCHATPTGMISPSCGSLMQTSGATPSVCVTPISRIGSGEKKLACDLGIRYGMQLQKGPRTHMEDRAVARLVDIEQSQTPHGYFAVFDGHGGSQASEYCAEHLHANILRSEFFPDMYSALQDGFLRTDADILRKLSSLPGKRGSAAGTAAAVVLATANELWFAHAGDCRVLLVKRDGTFKQLTHDHTAEWDKNVPFRVDEQRRIEEAGGTFDIGYVRIGDWSLPMTRALGALPLKRAQGRWQDAQVANLVVSALPECDVHYRSDCDMAVVLASDGLFGSVMTSAQVADCTREMLQMYGRREDAESLTAKKLIECAFFQHQGADNISVVVVSLDQQPNPLSHITSQESIATQVLSPVRRGHDIGQKLCMPFAEAYPDFEKENLPNA